MRELSPVVVKVPELPGRQLHRVIKRTTLGDCFLSSQIAEPSTWLRLSIPHTTTRAYTLARPGPDSVQREHHTLYNLA